jgi:hypothetical protein
VKGIYNIKFPYSPFETITDINILFPFPDKCLFKNFSAGVYSLEGKYCQFWGGQGMANYIHKNYIHNLLTACYDYIKSPTIDKGVINNFVNIPLVDKVLNKNINYYFFIRVHKLKYFNWFHKKLLTCSNKEVYWVDYHSDFH